MIVMKRTEIFNIVQVVNQEHLHKMHFRMCKSLKESARVNFEITVE